MSIHNYYPDFPYYLDDKYVLKEIGYSTKRKAREAIEKLELTKDIHYKEDGLEKIGNVGRPLEKVYLSEKGLQALCYQRKNRCSSNIEGKIAKKIATIENGKLEVPARFSDGRIDVLTKTEIIEVKQAKNWKHAVGQVVVYRLEYPHHLARIHLYGNVNRFIVENNCRKLNIRVTWED